MIKKITSILTRKQKIGMIIVVLVTLINALIETGATALIMPLSTALTASGDSKWDDFILYEQLGCSSRYEYIIYLCMAVISAYVLKCVFSIFNSYCQQMFSVRITSSISSKLFGKMFEKKYEYHLHHSSSEIQSIVTNDAQMFYAYLNGVLSVTTEIIVAVFMMILLGTTNFIFTVITVIVVFLAFSVCKLIVTPRIRVYGEQTRKYFGSRIKWITQAVNSLKSIYVSKKQKIFKDNYSHSTYQYFKQASLKNIFTVMPRNIIEAVCMIAVFTSMIISIVSGENVDEMLPVLATFAVAAIRLMPSANRIISNLNDMQFNKAGVESVIKVMHSEDDKIIESGINTSAMTVELKYEIAVKNLSFKYCDSDKYLFKNVNLSIPVGKSVAFIGTTGAGKTTMADIILGLLQPESGHVEFDGKDIKDNSYEWAKIVGYIPQTIYLCDDTIKNNIAFGLTEDKIDEDRVWECIKKSQLYDFITTLPDGINTVVGEGGIRLSGGQRQRVGIARALYDNPQFLVMDEATSALDNDTEKAIMESIDNLAGEKTLLIIAHRLSTIKNCDIVYRIQEGEVKVE